MNIIKLNHQIRTTQDSILVINVRSQFLEVNKNEKIHYLRNGFSTIM